MVVKTQISFLNAEANCCLCWFDVASVFHSRENRVEFREEGRARRGVNGGRDSTG